MGTVLRFEAKGIRGGALALLLVCALALRLLVPAGWMPVADAHGLHLTLCPGAGPIMPATPHVMAGMTHPGSAPHHDQASPDHACPFAGLSLALDRPTAPPTVAPPRVAPLPLPVRPLAVAIGRGLAAPPPPATGPPLLG